MGRLGRRIAEEYAAVRNDIYKFCEAMNFRPTPQQRELLDIIQTREPRLKVAVKSGKGPGKTTVSGLIALWWAIQSEGVKVVVTAPTARQCRSVWLAEVRRLLARADPWLQRIFTVTATLVKVVGVKDWGIETLTATKEEAVQGYHEKNLKVIIEEASGVDRPIIRALETTLSNERSAMLKIGNPNTRDSDFFDCFNSKRHAWHTLTFNAEDTPASDWFDPNRNRELEEEFGRDSDPYRISVLGEFPHADPSCVLSSEELEKLTGVGEEAQRLLYAAVRRSSAKQIGYDFARFGGDENTIYRRSGEAIVQWTRMAHTDPNVAVDKGFLWQMEAGWSNEDCWHVPDSTGMGQGVMQRFYNADKKIHEFGFGHSAIDSGKYANKITEAWFAFRRKVRKQIPYIPRDNLLIQQLCGRRYYVDKKGKIVLESKEDYVKRGHESPDRADGLILAFYDEFHNSGTAMRLDRGSRRVGYR